MSENTEYGLAKDGGSNSTWITIANGKLCIRADESEANEPDVHSRTYKDKDDVEHTIYERRYDHLVADIVGAGFETGDYGVTFGVELSVPDCGTYTLKLKAPGRLFDQFAKRIPNINKDVPLYVGAFKNEQGHNVLYLKQGGNKVPLAFTKDNPNGMPEPVKSTKMGKELWDFSDQEEFLYNLAKDWFGETESGEEDRPF